MDRSDLSDRAPTPEQARDAGGRKWVRPSLSKIASGSAEIGGDVSGDGDFLS